MRKAKQAQSYGRTDKTGHWKPPYACEYSPLFSGRKGLKEIFKYIFRWGGFIFPRHAFYTILAFGTYFLFYNDFVNFAGFTLEFILLTFLRNYVLVLIIFGGYHLLLYTFRVEGNYKKYHPDWTQGKSKKFLFGSQVKDNMFRTLAVGVPTWTLYEFLYIWLISIGVMPLITFSSNPVMFVAMFFLIPFWRETHFYIAHKLLHMGWMMKNVHNVHHMNPNTIAWSGLAMHPIESILYFSAGLIHFIVPSHPVHFIYNMQLTGLTPAQGHTGFEGPLLKGWLPVGDYFHYLHHKYVSCNFGAASIPWDKWFGIFFDGEGKFNYQKVKLIDVKGTSRAKKKE